MSATIKPINIVKITLEYETGTKIIVRETRTAKIGKLFFDTVKDNNIDWEIVENKTPRKKFFDKLKKFFDL